MAGAFKDLDKSGPCSGGLLSSNAGAAAHWALRSTTPTQGPSLSASHMWPQSLLTPFMNPQLCFQSLSGGSLLRVFLSSFANGLALYNQQKWTAPERCH